MKELLNEYFDVILETLIMSIFISVIMKVTVQFLTISV